jgi:putative tryptophan/tyrosine transport system substrate-binding protein
LFGYGQSYGAFCRLAATYVDKIFKGSKPSELPVEQPMIFELVINLATARRLNLTNALGTAAPRRQRNRMTVSGLFC